jgi:hypothetical protein
MASLILICASKYASGCYRYSSFWILFSGCRESALRAAGKEEPLNQRGQKKPSMVLDCDILKRKFSMRAGTEVLNCFYEARKTSTVSKVEFLNPEMLSMLGLIYADCFFVHAASRPPGRQAKGAPQSQGDQKKPSMVLDCDILKEKFSRLAWPKSSTAFMRLERSRISAWLIFCMCLAR